MQEYFASECSSRTTRDKLRVGGAKCGSRRSVVSEDCIRITLRDEAPC